MILGALLDLGVPLAKIKNAIRGLRLEGWTLRSKTVDRSGLRARKAIVRVADAGPRRGWRQIRALLQRGDLDARVRLRALDVFRRLLEAEAEAHGLPFSRIHLHAAGALDAIADLVGACAGLGHLAPDRIVVSEMTTGHGRIPCAHGSYPVPGPATLLMLRGVPSTSGRAEGERLTPTGAAILTTSADAYGPMPAMCPAAAGDGAGLSWFSNGETHIDW